MNWDLLVWDYGHRWRSVLPKQATHCTLPPLGLLLTNCSSTGTTSGLRRTGGGAVRHYFIMVPDTPQVAEVLFGEHGLC